MIVCMYKGRPAGYKIMGIDTEREKTSMLHRPKKRKSESDRKRMMGSRVSIRSENVHIDPRHACSRKIEDRRMRGRG